MWEPGKFKYPMLATTNSKNYMSLLKRKVSFAEVSSKTGENIQDLYASIALKIVEKWQL